jgi:hypothetical protein
MMPRGPSCEFTDGSNLQEDVGQVCQQLEKIVDHAFETTFQCPGVEHIQVPFLVNACKGMVCSRFLWGDSCRPCLRASWAVGWGTWTWVGPTAPGLLVISFGVLVWLQGQAVPSAGQWLESMGDILVWSIVRC